MAERSHAPQTNERTQNATSRTRIELPDETDAPDTAVRGSTQTPREFTGLDRQGKLVIAGLMLGMFVAAISQTIVGPALPRIVAELGGMEHYSWIATAAMLMSAVTVPVVGKLSDMYGRKTFYIGGLVVFMLGAALAGMATNFWFLVFARALQGAGMGTLMPLSQTIIGDIIPPRQRGKYQGLMGATFGIASVAGLGDGHAGVALLVLPGVARWSRGSVVPGEVHACAASAFAGRTGLPGHHHPDAGVGDWVAGDLVGWKHV